MVGVIDLEDARWARDAIWQAEGLLGDVEGFSDTAYELRRAALAVEAYIEEREEAGQPGPTQPSESRESCG